MIDFSAPAQAIGYYYQIRYALFLLLKSSFDSEVSIEMLDDIAFESEGSAIELIQTKHHVNSVASLSDASPDLWRTLRIWATAVIEDRIDLGSIRLLLVTNARAANDSAPSMLRHEQRNVDRAMDILRTVASTSTNQTNAAAYRAYMSLAPDRQKALLNCIQILDLSSDILDVTSLIQRELAFSTRPEFIYPLFQRVEGWWFDRAIKSLVASDYHRSISFSELRVNINDIAEQFHQDSLPIDFLQEIIPDETSLDQSDRIFLEQLRLIALSNERMRQAIGDYYRAYQQRSKWVREDLVLIDELTQYEDRLVDEWSRLFFAMKEEQKENLPESQKTREGRALYNMIERLNINIRPRCTEPYVMRGSFHILANALRVGWHTDFYYRLQHLLVAARRAAQ